MMALSKIDPAGLDIGQIGGRRNLIINGAMQVAQRGTSSSSTGYQTVDRWRLNLGTQQEQKTDTPDQFKNSMEITGTVAGSSGYGIVLQRIESNNIYGALGQNCTLSCYVKNTGTSTANVSVEVYRANSTDNFSAITLVSSLTSQPITSGWTRITFPAFAVPTTASTGLEVRIFRYDASNDQEWLITGVQLEVGTVATPFEHRSFGEELTLCRRYLIQTEHYGYSTTARLYTSSTGSMTSTNSWVLLNIQLPNEMRATPSIKYSDVAGNTEKLSLWTSTGGGMANNVAPHTDYADKNSFTISEYYSAKMGVIIGGYKAEAEL
jgi:hypothetical protein